MKGGQAINNGRSWTPNSLRSPLPASPLGLGGRGKQILLRQPNTRGVSRGLTAPRTTTIAAPDGAYPDWASPPSEKPRPEDHPIFQVDPGIIRVPPDQPWTAIVRHPNTYDPNPPPGCDRNRVANAFDNYNAQRAEVERSRTDLAQARDEKARQIAQRNLAIAQRALEQATPEYEFALRCTTGV